MASPTRQATKLSVIGAGSVGSSLAYAALIRGSANVVCLYDIAEQLVNAQVNDLAHGTQFTHSTIMGGPDIEATANSSVVIITAGARQQPGQTRLELAGVNAGILAKMMPQLVKLSPDALFVLVTNPCDVLTVVAQKISGLPTSQVFSTGTLLDTSRLRWLISEKTNVNQSNVHATIVGEHGDSEVPVWSSATISHIPIREWKVRGQSFFSQEELDSLAHDAAHAAYSIIEGKGATNYAIGLAGARLVEALLSPKRSVLPLSSVLDGYMGLKDVALSVPTLVSSTGIKRTLDIPMDDGEKERFLASARTLRESLASIGY